MVNLWVDCPAVKRFSLSPRLAEAGRLLITPCNFHYAGPNATDQPRRAHAIIYIPDYVTLTGGAEAAGAGDEMAAGGPRDHPLHPIAAGEE